MHLDVTIKTIAWRRTVPATPAARGQRAARHAARRDKSRPPPLRRRASNSPSGRHGVPIHERAGHASGHDRNVEPRQRCPLHPDERRPAHPPRLARRLGAGPARPHRLPGRRGAAPRAAVHRRLRRPPRVLADGAARVLLVAGAAEEGERLGERRRQRAREGPRRPGERPPRRADGAGGGARRGLRRPLARRPPRDALGRRRGGAAPPTPRRRRPPPPRPRPRRPRR